MTPSHVDRVREVVDPVVTSAGLHCEAVSVTAAGRRSVVRVVVDLDEDAIGSLDLDALGAVSSAVSAALDSAEPVRGPYVLEVTTPGTDRPLTELRHFRRARTRLVSLTLVDGTTVHGRLVDAGPDGLVVDESEVTRRLALDEVARGVVEVELNRAALDTPEEDD